MSISQFAFISSFGAKVEPVFSAVVEAANDVGGTVRRLRDETRPGRDITGSLWSLLRDAELVVADISSANNNVMYEIGVAHGLGKPVVMLLDGAVSTVPIDILANRIVVYDRGGEGVAILRFKLSKLFSEIVKQPSAVDGLYGGPAPMRGEHTHVQAKLGFGDIDTLDPHTRNRYLEQWFMTLVSAVDGWDVAVAESRSGYDVVIWNAIASPGLVVLGNPIAVELKAVNKLKYADLTALADRAKSQGLNGLVVVTTASVGTHLATIARELLRSKSFTLVVLDRDDLFTIETPGDVVQAIERQAVATVSGGSSDV